MRPATVHIRPADRQPTRAIPAQADAASTEPKTGESTADEDRCPGGAENRRPAPSVWAYVDCLRRERKNSRPGLVFSHERLADFRQFCGICFPTDGRR